MDPNSLEQLLKSQTQSQILKYVFHLDLTQIKQSDVLLSKPYNIATASLVLHQLSFEQINETFRFLLNNTVQDGLIINCDVASHRWYQCLLVPSNETDRESYVPTYNDSDFILPIIFMSDTAKVAYPLRHLTEYFPSKEIRLYAISIYLSVTLPKVEAIRLKALWEGKQYSQCDQLIKKYSEKFSADLSI